MKKRLLSLLLTFTIFLPIMSFYGEPVYAAEKENDELFNAVWVTTVYNLDYPLKSTTNADTLKAYADDILDSAEANGFNAIILQVRPSADSFYDSAYFPWSKYLTGTAGLAPNDSFDPLEYWIEEAHARDMELHAWINPFRITKSSTTEYNALPSDHPAVEHPEYVVYHTDGNYYFDPGLSEVQELIIDSTVEIVEKYDVDGIHLDDYFYPSATFDDYTTYANNGAGYTSIETWRRDNITTLVSDLNDALHEADEDIVFGISPAGIWRNSSNDPLGSDTSGNETYSSHYADTYTWVKEELIDYIAPQIYWEFDYKYADYATLVDWWADVVSGTDVDLYIGIAAYRNGETDITSPWYGTDQLDRQLEYNYNTVEVSGNILFRQTFIESISGLSDVVKKYFVDGYTVDNSTDTDYSFDNDDFEKMVAPVAPVDNGLMIGRPDSNVTTTYSTYYLTGTSDPNYPVYINGIEITDKSDNGNWGYYATLSTGSNKFTVTQTGQTSDSVTITKSSGTTSTSYPFQTTAAITNAYPTTDYYKYSKNTVTLSATAPIGATVTASIGGETFTLSPSSSYMPDSSKIYTTTYSYTYTIPDFDGYVNTVELGRVVYNMTYNGRTYSESSNGILTAVTDNAILLAEVTADVAPVYFSYSTSNGSSGELYKGMRDTITDIYGSYYKLSTGDWIYSSNVSVSSQKDEYTPAMLGTSYISGDKFDEIRFDLSAASSGKVSYENGTVTLVIPSLKNALAVNIPSSSPLASCSYTLNNGIATYSFKVDSGTRIDGYYLDISGDDLVLYIKNPVEINLNSTYPLDGINIVLDPGHGGSNPGAIGGLGGIYAESEINFAVSAMLYNNLTSLGATVTLTKETEEEDPSLEERVTTSREIKPDMFISIHTNSLAENYNMASVEGLAVFYYNELSKNFALSAYNQTSSELSRPTRGFEQMKYYVTKGTWSVAYLYEIGFITNPRELEYLTDPTEQQALADSLTNAILDYFS